MKKGMLSVVVLMLMFFGWAFWTSSSHSGNSVLGSSSSAVEIVYGSDFYSYKEIGPNGTVFSVKTGPSHFSFKGFVQYSKSPRVKERKLRKAKNVYFLRGGTGPGFIAIYGLQKNKKKPKDVSVVIKYFRHWEGQTSFQVVGTDLKKTEELVEQIPVDGDGGFCTRLIFMGPVDQVTFEGEAEAKEGYIMIDDILVGVGTKAFDELDEVKCE